MSYFVICVCLRIVLCFCFIFLRPVYPMITLYHHIVRTTYGIFVSVLCTNGCRDSMFINCCWSKDTLSSTGLRQSFR